MGGPSVMVTRLGRMSSHHEGASPSTDLSTRSATDPAESRQCRTGDVSLLITKEWTQETHQGFLSVIRSHWRGWNIVLFEDRAGQHTSPDSLEWAEELGIEVRLLPRATPELNAMDHLWRHTKREALGDRETVTIDGSALAACQHIIDLSPEERLRQGGIFSGSFWLAK